MRDEEEEGEEEEEVALTSAEMNLSDNLLLLVYFGCLVLTK